jgi:uncharacterized protein YbjQ (UPF0145 family)
MLCVTTNSIDGRVVIAHLGIVAGEVIFGANFIKDFLSDVSDVLGGRNTAYESVFQDARGKALEIIKDKARALGANAIIGVTFDYTIMGAQNGMIMVAATGTAVQLTKSDAELKKDLAHANDEKPQYYVQLGGSEKGPFSKAQLRQLVANGRLDETASIRAEDNQQSMLSNLLAE